jgi:hypothetical protein
MSTIPSLPIPSLALRSSTAGIRIRELTSRFSQALQHAVERVNKYLVTLEEKMEALERKKK